MGRSLSQEFYTGWKMVRKGVNMVQAEAEKAIRLGESRVVDAASPFHGREPGKPSIIYA